MRIASDDQFPIFGDDDVKCAVHQDALKVDVSSIIEIFQCISIALCRLGRRYTGSHHHLRRKNRRNGDYGQQNNLANWK